MNRIPRILFAAPGSGSGKTMITCGMIEVWKRRNLQVASFKCGPDYIDPMFHRRVLGIASGNLDTFFTDADTTGYLLAKGAGNADITVIEGVMGYYDGLGGQSEQASTYETAKVTDTPVLLIVDAKGASVSLAAVIKGMLEYRKDSRIQGVILNRVSAGYYERLKELIERECGIRVFGYVPQMEELTVPSRHLGLVAPEEMQGFQEWIKAVADVLENTVDHAAILDLAGQAESVTWKMPELPKLSGSVRLAVARDEAFSFYYTENIQLLEEMGAELVFFSPLHDSELPQDIDGLLLWGGYPENYAGELEQASGMRKAIREACEKGLPCLAECGGFLYLQKELEGQDGNICEMSGVLSGTGYRTKNLCRFGYIELENRCAGVLGDSGETIRGHEFHYWDCTENGDDFMARKPGGSREYPCIVHTKTMAAGFPHLYYYSNPDMIFRFLLTCQSFQAGRRCKQHWDSIAKPIDSLGMLEEYVVRMSRMLRTDRPYDIGKRALVILCGDHGVTAEGVTQTGREVTRIVSENFAKGCSTVNHMAKSAKTDIFTVDIGMDTPPYPEKRLVQGTVIDRKVARGCGNIAKEPAMTLEQCRQAVETGKDIVKVLKERGYRILATGEMGIGNTTPTSVLAALLLNQPAEAVTGKGAGLSLSGRQKKCRVVEQAVERVREKGLTDPFEILAEAGGYELAGMAGIFLGGAAYQMPIVIDGAISAVSALIANRIDQRVSDYVIASHVSEEITGKMALEDLGVDAVLHAKMCLGEGTGAVALFPLLDMALEVYSNMGTFGDYEIVPYERYEEEHI